MIKKIAVITSGLLMVFMFAFAQQMELNDPQIISVVETVNRIDMDYGEIALDRAQNNKVRAFAQAMVDDHTDLYKQTLALEQELILSIQTNVITRFLLKRKSANVKRLKSRDQKYFDITYVDNEVIFYESAVSTLKDILIPQARNEKLKHFLTKIAPVWERDLEAAKKIQAEINR